MSKIKVARHLDEFVLYQDEIEKDLYDSLLKEAKNFSIRIYLHYQQGIDKTEEIILPYYAADLIVLDKDNNIEGLYIKYKPKGRLLKARDVLETFVDKEGRFGIEEEEDPSGQIDYQQEFSIRLRYKDKTVNSHNELYPLTLKNPDLVPYGIYEDELKENIRLRDVHEFNISEKECSTIYAESLLYGIMIHEDNDDYEATIYSSINSSPISFPIVRREDLKIVGFLVQNADENDVTKLYVFKIGENNVHNHYLNSKLVKQFKLVRLNQPMLKQKKLICKMGYGPFWKTIAKQI